MSIPVELLTHMDENVTQHVKFASLYGHFQCSLECALPVEGLVVPFS